LSTKFLNISKVPPFFNLGLPNICEAYDFVQSEEPNGLNLIVMQLLGKDLDALKKHKGKEFTQTVALKLLVV